MNKPRRISPPRIIVENKLEESVQTYLTSSTPISNFHVDEARCAAEFLTLNEYSKLYQEVFQFNGPSDPRREKNRYIDVLPHPVHRVKLSVVDQDENSDYINADLIPNNLLPGAKYSYIAASAPLGESVRADFWNMIWEKQCSMILMLTDLVENHMPKAEVYWPSGDETVVFDNILVQSIVLPLQDEHFSIRKFRLTLQEGQENQGEEKAKELIVTHLWFTAWPDHQVPYGSLVSYMETYRGYRDMMDVNHPILCHCSAGIGRTGSFIALDVILDSINSEHLSQSSNSEADINVFQIVSKLRRYRMGMVQTKVQYIFIAKFLEFCLREGKLGVTLSLPVRPSPAELPPR